MFTNHSPEVSASVQWETENNFLHSGKEEKIICTTTRKLEKQFTDLDREFKVPRSTFVLKKIRSNLLNLRPQLITISLKKKNQLYSLPTTDYESGNKPGRLLAHLD